MIFMSFMIFTYNLGNFSKRGDMASIITVIQFSGISQYTKEYIPGVGNGKIGMGSKSVLNNNETSYIFKE